MPAYANGGGLALPQGAGAATGGSFSSAATLTSSQSQQSASASAVVAGLVDVLPSADAVGRAADTVGRVAFVDSRFKVGVC